MNDFLKKTDFKLIFYLVVYYTIVTILSTIKIVNRNLNWIKEGHAKEENINWNKIYVDIFFDWAIVIFFMILIVFLTKKMIQKQIKWKTILGIHLFFSLILGYIIYFVYNVICFLKGDFPITEIFERISLRYIIQVIDLNFLIYTAMTAIIYIYYYIKEIKAVESQKAELLVQLNSTKLNLLKSNLNPHFLFNTLNSVSSLIESNPQQAQNTLADLGDLLRDLLDQKDKVLITVKEELNILKKYLNIIKVRFSDHFIFRKDIEKGVLNAKIPSMLLQPLIENAIKHGYSYDHNDLEIDLEIKENKDRLEVYVLNNGKQLDQEFRKLKKGVGIKNTLERLKTIYKNDYTFKLENSIDKKQVIAYVSIPYSEA